MVAKEPDLRIIHDDPDFVVVDKPAGLLSVPVSPGTAVNLFDIVASHFDSENIRIGSVHRIDRYTSGLMIFSKNNEAHQNLLKQFREHTARRCYLAVTRGLIKKEQGELSHYLKLIKEGFRNIVVPKEEKGATPARLTYKVKERFVDTTLVEVCLDTGLKNQIRVQFEESGHQLVGDQHYAPNEEEEPLINRQALHASLLEFDHPKTGKRVSFECLLPVDMLKLIDHYRWQLDLNG
ncbi:MAG: RluA family pseudouridine synthase [Balneolaceae bacterium]|nr:RluA family pseudouridine synthase [Balneolaceae bacterium]